MQIRRGGLQIHVDDTAFPLIYSNMRTRLCAGAMSTLKLPQADFRPGFWLNRPTADTLRLRERIKGTLFHEQPPQIVPRHMCSDTLLHAVVCGAVVRGRAGCRATVRCFAGGICAPAPRADRCALCHAA